MVVCDVKSCKAEIKIHAPYTLGKKNYVLCDECKKNIEKFLEENLSDSSDYQEKTPGHLQLPVQPMQDPYIMGQTGISGVTWVPTKPYAQWALPGQTYTSVSSSILYGVAGTAENK